MTLQELTAWMAGAPDIHSIRLMEVDRRPRVDPFEQPLELTYFDIELRAYSAEGRLVEMLRGRGMSFEDAAAALSIHPVDQVLRKGFGLSRYPKGT